MRNWILGALALAVCTAGLAACSDDETDTTATGGTNQGGAATGGTAQGGAATGGTAQGGAGGVPTSGTVCTTDDDCIGTAVCYEGLCVASGSGLRISLSWEATADLDLHVLTPAGNQIYWETPEFDGGFLDVDDCSFLDPGFDCKDPTGTHVENVYFEAPADGEYRLVAYGYETDGADVNYTVTAFLNDVEIGTDSGAIGTDELSAEYVITLPVP